MLIVAILCSICNPESAAAITIDRLARKRKNQQQNINLKRLSGFFATVFYLEKMLDYTAEYNEHKSICVHMPYRLCKGEYSE